MLRQPVDLQPWVQPAQFIGDVASRLSSKVQMTTDGLKLYLNATEGAFGGAIDYAMLTKLYGASGNDTSAETRYSPGRIKGMELAVISGDARLSMESELNRGQPQDFNLLAIDAFSGDAIPVHLLTEEAFQIYLKEVRSGGVIAVHITNTYFDLRPVLLKVAERFGLHYALFHTDGDGALTTYSDWVLLSRDKRTLDALPRSTESTRSSALKPDISLWTDDYSNLFWVLRR